MYLLIGLHKQKEQYKQLTYNDDKNDGAAFVVNLQKCNRLKGNI